MNNLEKNQKTILGRDCICFQRGEKPEYLLLQPVDGHDIEELDTELDYICRHSDKAFRFVAIPVTRWFDELSPWPAPPVFGKTPFGDGAGKTLEWIQKACSEAEAFSNSVAYHNPSQREGLAKSLILGGYSLAGLFALWAGYQTELFDGIVAASPSVWFKDWLDYAEKHTPKATCFYLSLGDREVHSKTPLLTTVGTAIRRQQELLSAADIPNTLEWNPGNHFMDNGIRTAKGFVWAMNR
ncbi:MAG: hypothetical protein PUF37_05310 [Prevotellaceae bacterium]|nr:hypothetical protein [Prevotella sp.]MDD6552990.1 hypothetical protein [Prevotellaceae bacterium]